MFRIGSISCPGRVIAAPMAGVSDRAFRRLCMRFGAAMATGEMVASDPRLWNSRKSAERRVHGDDPSPRAVQIAGADPDLIALAARQNVDAGAELIDINMGCPAKKVCNALAGSALLADEVLVGRIFERAVAAVDVPVTVKIRTGVTPHRRNAVRIARVAEQAGIAAITIHGRTRACGFGGVAEYETIREVKRLVRIPVIANGDIRTPDDARRVLDSTGADAVMIGRAAQGRPWLFREVAAFLACGDRLAAPAPATCADVLDEHLDGLHAHYGAERGVRVARKHLRWYLKGLPEGERFWQRVRDIDDAAQQRREARAFLAAAWSAGCE